MADALGPFFGAAAPRLAERLIDRFGGLGRALSADPAGLDDREIAEACRVIQAARKLSEAAIREDLRGTSVSRADPALIEYLRSVLCGEDDERFHAVFADRAGGYLRDETVAVGSKAQLSFRARALFHRAMELGASRLLLAHNHPSGLCRPSALDIETTQALQAIGGALEVELIDHLIVTKSRVFSFRDEGLI